MTRAPGAWSVAVRKPEGHIVARRHVLGRLADRNRAARIPFVRGIVVLWESLSLGFRALSWSAEMAAGDEEEPLTKSQIGWTMALAFALFAGIFICIIPVIAMLRAGADGAFAPLVGLVTTPSGEPNDLAYFWMTGLLSSFLDNAPTYLVFFELAGGDPETLMTRLASTPAAISAGAVFMGANTYIGNAPNFMVKAIVENSGIRMPSFFGYMLWSGAILVPLFLVVTLLFFR